MTSIVHCKKNFYDVYIGRPSKWGNPFSHKEGTSAKFKVNTRDEAIKAFHDYFWFGEGRWLQQYIDELKDKKLGCWCAPLSCHGDILANAVWIILGD